MGGGTVTTLVEPTDLEAAGSGPYTAIDGDYVYCFASGLHKAALDGSSRVTLLDSGHAGSSAIAFDETSAYMLVASGQSIGQRHPEAAALLRCLRGLGGRKVPLVQGQVRAARRERQREPAEVGLEARRLLQVARTELLHLGRLGESTFMLPTRLLDAPKSA